MEHKGLESQYLVHVVLPPLSNVEHLGFVGGSIGIYLVKSHVIVLSYGLVGLEVSRV